MKNFLKKLKDPHPFVYVLVFLTALVALALMTYFFLVNSGVPNAMYIAYALSAVSLVFGGYSVYLIVHLSKMEKNPFRNFLQRWKVTGKLAENYDFRTFVFTIPSFVFNLLFAVYNAYFGWVNSSLKRIGSAEPGRTETAARFLRRSR